MAEIGKNRRPQKTRGEQIKSFADVQAGDYVVHESHGIGKFVGIEQLTVQGVQKDYLKVKYAGEDSLVHSGGSAGNAAEIHRR